MKIPYYLLPLVATVSITCPAYADTTDDATKGAAQVFLEYRADSSSVYTARYSEMIVQKSTAGSYFSSNGFYNSGYIGVQELPTPYANGKANHVIVFSLWDNVTETGKTADKAQLIARGTNVRTSQVGSKSTGGQAYLAYDWKVGETIRTLVIEKADGKGSHQVAGYFYNPSQKKWQLISCWKVSATTTGLSRGYAFVEDGRQDGASKDEERRALFGPVLQWNGTKWESPANFTFGKDSNPANNINLSLDEKSGLLSLATGGDIAVSSSYPLSIPFVCSTLPSVKLPGGEKALIDAPVGKPLSTKTNGAWEPTNPVNWAKDAYSSSFADGVELRLTDKAAGTINHAWYIVPVKIVFNNSDGHTYSIASTSKPYTGDTQIVKKGTGRLNIANSNGYKGGTLIYDGTVVSSADWSLGSGDVTLYGGTLHMGGKQHGNMVNINASSTATLNGAGKFVGNLYLNKGTVTGQNVNLNKGNGALVYSGTLKNNLVGDGCVIKEKTGTVCLSGSSTYTGGTYIKAGTLSTKSAKALGTGVVSLTGGTLHMNSYALPNTVIVESSSAVIKGGAKYNGTLVMNKGTLTGDKINIGSKSDAFLRSGSVKNVLSGAGWVVKETKGKAYLFGANSYTGGTLIKEGTLTAKSKTALGKGGVTMTGGTLHMNSQALANTVYANAPSVIIKGASKFNGSLVLTKGTLTGDKINIGSKSDVFLRTGTVQNVLTGAGWVVKETKGTANLAASNSYTGGTLIKEGTLVPKTPTSFGKGGIVMMGGTLQMNSYALGNTLNINASSSAVVKGCAKYNGTLVLTKGKLSGDRINIQSGKDAFLRAGTVNNVLTGTGWVVKETKGTANLAAANSYTGGTLIKAGTLVAKTATSLGRGGVSMLGGTLNMNSNALVNTLSVNASSAVVKGSTKFKGTLVLEKGTLSGDKINIFAYRDAYLKKGTIKNALTGTGVVCKYDPGTVTLAGTNNWTGNTYVQGGTLVITGPSTLRGETYTYDGGKLDVRRSISLGKLCLAGGTLSLKAGTTLTVTDVLTLGNPTALAVSGATSTKTPAVIKYGKLNNVSRLALSKFFAASKDVKISASAGQLAIYSKVAKSAAKACEPEDLYTASVDSLGQSTWGTARAARLFGHTVRDHAQAQSVALDKNRSVWFAAMSGFSHVDDAADTNIYGGAVGMQFNGTMGGSTGLAIGQTSGHVSPAHDARVKQQSQHAALYGTKMLYTSATDSVSLTGTASYGTTDCDYDGFGWTQHSTVLGVRGTWEHKLDKATSVYGFAGLEYLATDAECGSGSIQALQGSIGAGISHTEGNLTLHADASFTPDMVRNAPSTTVSTGRLGFEVGAGATYRLSDQWSLNAGYTYHNEKRADSHEAYIGARCTF